MKSPTLQNIADEVDMSLMTVSRALRGIGRVNDETRRRIRQAASDLGYTEAHQGLLTPPRNRGRTEPGLRLIVVTLPSADFGSELARDLIRGIESRLEFNAGTLTEITVESLEEILEAWDDHKASGLVLRSELPAEWVQALIQRGPVIYGSSFDVEPGIDAVYSNEFRSASMVQKYLSNHGHENILWLGVVNTSPGAPLSSRERQLDLAAASIHGPRYAAWAFFGGHFAAPASGRALMLEMAPQVETLNAVIERGLDTQDLLACKPTAIVVPTDYMGVALIEVLQARGYRIPEDFSIVSYGGTDIRQRCKPMLTSVKLPMYTIGLSIPELVERRLANPESPPVTLQLEASIEEGETVTTITSPCNPIRSA